MKKFFLVVAAFAALLAPAFAQKEESKVSVDLNADLVSSYIWRGLVQNPSFCVQPSLGLNIADFNITAWGSTDLQGEVKEVDLLASYSFKGFTFMLSDYWVSANAAPVGYFEYEDGHSFEAGISYFNEKFPIRLSAYTFFAGADKKWDSNGKEKQAYSTYVEAAYLFSKFDIDFELAAGFSLFDSPGNYGNEGINMINLALQATKSIKITESFSVPIFAQLVLNPNTEDVHFAVGFKF